jgi:Ig-like domain-containing protein
MTRSRGPSGRPNRPGQRGRRNRKLSAAQAAIAAAVIGAVGTVTAASVGVFDKPATSQPAASESVVSKVSPSSPSSQGPKPSGPLIPGDNSSFVADVTYPDGSAVTEGQHLMKKWEIRNIGTVLWVNRYLVANGTQTGLCTYPSRVLIPLTRPGQNVIISVPVTGSDSPGMCFVTWKMETNTGTLYFPNEVGIWFSIKVDVDSR